MPHNLKKKNLHLYRILSNIKYIKWKSNWAQDQHQPSAKHAIQCQNKQGNTQNTRKCTNINWVWLFLKQENNTIIHVDKHDSLPNHTPFSCTAAASLRLIIFIWLTEYGPHHFLQYLACNTKTKKKENYRIYIYNKLLIL